MGESAGTKLQVKPWVAVVALAVAVVIFGGIWLAVGNRRLEREYGPAGKGKPRSHGNELAMKLNLAGNSYAIAGMYDSALACYREALRIAEQASNTRRMAACYQNISNVFDYKNMPESVRFYMNAAIAMNRASGSRKRSIGGLIEQGTFMFNSLGDVDSGRVLLEKGLAECRQMDDSAGEVVALYNLGSVQAALKHYDSARVMYESCAAISRELKDKSTEAGALHRIALTYLWHDRLDEAKSWLLQAIEVAHSGEVVGEEASALFDAALVRAELGDRELAKVNAEQALKLYERAGDNGGMNACRAFLEDIVNVERWQHRARTLDSLMEQRRSRPDPGM